MARGAGWLAASLVGFCLGAPAEAEPAHVSTRTRHDYPRCEARASPHPGIVEIRRCRGPRGIAVNWSADDDSSSVTFGARPFDEEFGMTGFFEAGREIAWRGPAGAAPVAAILPYRVGSRIGALDATKLVVYRLNGARSSCIMAIVAGDDAAARAAALVDRFATGFRCGTDRRLSPDGDR
jgi:hypothetical protein